MTVGGDTVLGIIYVAVACYLVVFKKANLLKHFAIASLVALTWMIIARAEYGYNMDVVSVFGINLYGLFAWSLGLFGVYVIYLGVRRLVPVSAWWKQLLLFTAVFIPILLFAETIAYYQFNVVNLGTSAYEGLPICGCIHAPDWMKAAYLSMGAIYFAICLTFNLDDVKVESAGFYAPQDETQSY